MKKTVLITLVAAICASAVTLFFADRVGLFGDQVVRVEHVQSEKVLPASFSEKDNVSLDFTEAAAVAMPAVVHIKATQTRQVIRKPYRHPLEEFFWPDWEPQTKPKPEVKVGTGSGVIISADGYIVTNNHVIDGADDLDITTNDNRSFKAEVVGVDASTDLALLKIDAEDLEYLLFGASDDVKVGQWVLAVGNPFNLTSTVTAGIISAKGRNINILRDKYAIESFLQTDAAINPGNSGGALVSLQGELIGINTAIASPTGSYSGYGFAVPSEIVKKVTDDLKEFGIVQRGFIGVMIQDVSPDLVKKKDLQVNDGVYVSDLLETGAAKQAGVKPGDVIVSIGGQTIHTSPELQEAVGRARPGDELMMRVNRGGEEIELTVMLTNKSGNTKLISKDKVDLLEKLGIEVVALSKEERKEMNIENGVKVKEILSGTIKRFTDMRPGFVITQIDKKNIESVDDLIEALKGKKGGVMIEGKYPGYSQTFYYAFGM